MFNDDPELEVLHLEDGGARVKWKIDASPSESPRSHSQPRSRTHSNSATIPILQQTKSNLNVSSQHNHGWDSKYHSSSKNNRIRERTNSPSIYHKLITLFYDTTPKRRRHGKNFSLLIIL